MASWREIERYRTDIDGCRALARSLLQRDAAATGWEVGFLTDVAKWPTDALTTRQSEKLLQIRDGMEIVKEWRGFSISVLLGRCFDARSDLSEPDEEWIVSLRGGMGIRRNQLGRFLTVCRQLGLIEIEGDLQ